VWWGKYARAMIANHDTGRLLTGFNPEDTEQLRQSLRPRQAMSTFFRRQQQGFQDLADVMGFFGATWEDVAAAARQLHHLQFKEVAYPHLYSWQGFPLGTVLSLPRLSVWVNYMRTVRCCSSPPLPLLEALYSSVGPEALAAADRPFTTCFLAFKDPERSAQPTFAQVSWVIYTAVRFSDPAWINVAFARCVEGDHKAFVQELHKYACQFKVDLASLDLCQALRTAVADKLPEVLREEEERELAYERYKTARSKIPLSLLELRGGVGGLRFTD